MGNPQRKRLTPDERDAIIEQRLNRVPVRQIASSLDTTTKTVVEVFKKWLIESAEERNAELESVRELLIQRQDKIAADARLGALRSKAAADSASEARFLAEERAALREIARLSGADAPTKVEHTGEVQVDLTNAKANLLARLEGMTK
jgi:hypothetical protein